VVRIVEVRERTVPLASPGRNAFIDFADMTVSVVVVITDVRRGGRPVVGFGFNSNGRYAAGGILRERLLPRLARAEEEALLDEAGENLDPSRIWDVVMAAEKPGGHGERSVAVGTLDMALWDATAKIAELPLARVFAERFGDGAVEDSVSVYAAGGYYRPDEGTAELREEIETYLALGYTTVKIKIGGAPLADDVRRIEAVLDVVGDGSRLAVDANGRFDLPTALRYAEVLEPYGLRWYEEPGDPLDYELCRQVAASYPGALATGENLFSTPDARNLIRYAGLRPEQDVLQFDCALSYGVPEYLRTLAMLDEHGWSRRACVPHGGHQLSLHLAAGLGLGGNESYPSVFAPFGGFADGVAVEEGRVRLPDVPGIGFETKADLLALLHDELEIAN
jgi:D(-)-tartrate dehydratase